MAPLYHLCSQIQNSFKWQLRRIAVPNSKPNRAICQILYDEGFVSSVALGDETGPFPANAPVFTGLATSPSPQPTSTPSSSSSATPNRKSALVTPPPNPARLRIWLDLKYKHSRPVLSRMSVVSKPSRRVYASLRELQAVAAARRAGPLLKGQEVGQITILDTPYGIIELKEALKQEVGGEVLCIAV
ncbi:ribosomal protein S8 [Fimicolochytrium jonesii]|uniref:ribosomal protein S8 n=1 Tax=Fimicolochytrium jonesii TaxID=1396493 RepID=UPI0022FE7F71|nr:ribosomal protein S8 [Fimicolochytrium jonesii]KAI8817558.1 ribosomal protein S8 [Fimicolochytrium jonesii]